MSPFGRPTRRRVSGGAAAPRLPAALPGAWAVLALLLALVFAGGCEDFNPFPVEEAPPPMPEQPAPEQPPPPPEPERPPDPIYPMGLRARDLAGWVFSPDRTAAAPVTIRNTTIRDFSLGKTVSLTAEGQAYSWSPDSQWLLYWNRGWCVVRRDGQVNRRLTQDDTGRSDRPQPVANLPLWHPDGPSVILFDGQRYRVVSVDGQRDRQIATSAQIPGDRRSTVKAFYLSPDGRWLFYIGSRQVGYLTADGQAHRVLTDGLWNCTPPKWSADCNTMAVLADNRTQMKAQQVWRIDLPDGRVTPVCRRDPIRTMADDWAGDLSPDGRWVVYAARDVAQPRIVLADTQTPGLKKIHHDPDPRSLRFSPDGKWIAYVSPKQRDLVVLSVQEPRGMRLGCPDLVGPKPPDLRRWADDSRSVTLETSDYTLCAMSLDGKTCTRLWPDAWEEQAQETPLETSRVPLELEELEPSEAEFKAVAPASADLTPSAQNLPIQVVVPE